MRDIGAALRALGPRRGVDKLTGVGDAHGVLDLEVVVIRAPFRDANRRGVHDSGDIAFNDDLGARPSSGACTGLPGGYRDRAHNFAVLEDVHFVFVDVDLDDSRLTNLEGTLDVMGDPAVTGGRETGEVAAHVDFRAGLPKVLGAPHQLGVVEPSPRSLLLWGDINVHGLLNLGAHVSVDDLVPELDDDRHADANRSIVVEHLDDVDGTIDALDVLGHRRCRASMGVGIREGRSDGVRGLETPRFRRGPHCVLESARDFAALGIRDMTSLRVPLATANFSASSGWSSVIGWSAVIVRVAGVGVGVGVGVAEFPLEPKPLPTEVLAQAAAVIGKATAPVARTERRVSLDGTVPP